MINVSLNKLYILRRTDKVITVGKRRKKRYSYVQMNYTSHNPIVITDIGYRSDLVIFFAGQYEAQKFLTNFILSNRRRSEKYDWDIVEFKGEVSRVKEVETIYGNCLIK